MFVSVYAEKSKNTQAYYISLKTYQKLFEFEYTIDKYHIMPGAFYLELIQFLIATNLSTINWSVSVSSFGTANLFVLNDSLEKFQVLEFKKRDINNTSDVIFYFPLMDQTMVENRDFDISIQQNVSDPLSDNFFNVDTKNTKIYNLRTVYNNLAKYKINLGQSFRCLKNISFEKNKTRVHLIKNNYINDNGIISGCLMHGLFQALTFYLSDYCLKHSDNINELFLPSVIDKIEMFRHSEINQAKYIDITLVNNYALDVTLVSSANQALVKIKNMSFQKHTVDEVLAKFESYQNPGAAVQVFHLLKQNLSKFIEPTLSNDERHELHSAIIFIIASKIVK